MKALLNQRNGRFALTLAFSFYFAACAPKNFNSETSVQAANTSESSRIVGGENATASFQQQNGIVALAITSRGFFFNGGLSICTGTLIDRRIVLTAAHCLQARPGTRITKIDVYFIPDIQKSLDTGNLRNSISGDKIANHPDFQKGITDENVNTEAWNDIALIRLKSNAPVQFKLAKLPQADESARLSNGDKVILSGFGIATPIVNQTQINPKTGKEEVVPVSEKIETSGILRKIENVPVLNSINDKELLLDQSNSTGACHGDSGGPAFVTQADGSLSQVGVTSRGTNKLGNCNEQAIYTKVSSHLAWIEANKASLLKAK